MVNEEVLILAIELKNISFLINAEEVAKYLDSTSKIIEYYNEYQCPKDLANKQISYKTTGVEINMKLSMSELHLLSDLMKGVNFHLTLNKLIAHTE